VRTSTTIFETIARYFWLPACLTTNDLDLVVNKQQQIDNTRSISPHFSRRMAFKTAELD
jgi:hypothetical protein